MNYVGLGPIRVLGYDGRRTTDAGRRMPDAGHRAITIALERNILSNYGSGPPKEQSYQVLLKSAG